MRPMRPLGRLAGPRDAGDLDTVRLTQQLNGETAAEADEPEMVLDASEAHMPASVKR